MDINYFHEQVWRRFVRMPYGHVLDYTDIDGTYYAPTTDECQKAMPNPLGWWTPIENGAFFTGLYVYALITKYNTCKSEKAADEIRLLMNGLFLLQDVGNVEGFIARGVADDGRSHYPFSSEDQFTPWVLAMFSYYRCELCECKEDVKKRLLRALTAVRENGWNIPCDVEGLYYCNWENTAAWRGVSKMLLCARVIYELTSEKKDLDLYHSLAIGRPADSLYTRLEIVSHGYSHDLVAFLGAKQNWICTCAHLGLRELVWLDPDNAEYFKSGLRSNGITTLGIIDDMKKYDNCREGFDINWRRLAPLWEDYENDVAKGLSIASRESVYWQQEIVPHRKMEHSVLGNALFSALIAITCGEERIARRATQKLIANCAHINWETLHLSYAFVVESSMIFGA